jgi:hypothetical protein
MSSRSEIAAFLTAAKSVVPASAGGSGRLAFALDATMSRQPTWDSACKLQAEMFDAVGKTAALSVQLVYFRGLGECRASRWINDTRQLADLMTRIDCRGGQTQIGRVLRHVADEAKDRPVSALVYIGDAMEEDIDKLAVVAGELALRKVPCFMFHEGHDPAAAVGVPRDRPCHRRCLCPVRPERRIGTRKPAQGRCHLCHRWQACAGEVRRISGAIAARATRARKTRQGRRSRAVMSAIAIFLGGLLVSGGCRRWPDERQSFRSGQGAEIRLARRTRGVRRDNDHSWTLRHRHSAAGLRGCVCLHAPETPRAPPGNPGGIPMSGLQLSRWSLISIPAK